MTDHTAQIIQLFGPRPKPGKTYPLRVTVSAERPAYLRHEPATITAENSRLRSDRRDVWREANAVMGYWLAAMRMHSAISILQNYGAVEVEQYPFIEPESHGDLVKKYGLAWAKLMLTPAPGSNDVRWKRMQLLAEHWHYTGLSAEQCEQAIDTDEEWLKAHPVRRKGGRKPSNSGEQQ
jgi:hypothetical protein